MFSKKKEKKEPSAQKQPEMKQYITGAGACVVTKSVLNGETRLKWFFREQNGIGNGWVAFGASDSQAYIDNAENFAVVDFNTLANVEPAVLNVLYMPVGTDLEFKEDKTGKYFVDTRTGKEIREPVKHPVQLAFEKNRKFLNQKDYPPEYFQELFKKGKDMEVFIMGEADFPSGEIVVADPLAYLGSKKYSFYLNRRIPAGAYPVELSIFRSPLAGLRIAAAKLKVSSKEVEHYEIAMPVGTTIEQYGQQGIWNVMGVDAGLGCFCDAVAAEEYEAFIQNWRKENPEKNQYDDYFAALFQKSYEEYPRIQREGGDFLTWSVPETGHRITMFASGMGDGIYSVYWGLDEEDQVAELIIPFMNPEFFR